MNSFIEEFYYGNIDPQARSSEQNKKVQRDIKNTKHESHNRLRLFLPTVAFLHVNRIKWNSIPNNTTRRYHFGDTKYSESLDKLSLW